MKFKLLSEFKEFAIKGNMMDIAIGVIIGTAFNKVVNTLVKQIILPPLSLMTDGINWEDKKLILRPPEFFDGELISQEVAIGYGLLFETLMDFLVIAISIFLVIKFLNKMRNKSQDPEDKTVNTPKNIELLSKMTKLMEKQNSLLEELNEKSHKP